MEMIGSFCGDKCELCLAVIKSKHVRRCSSFDITYVLMHRMKNLGYFVRKSRHM